MSSSKEKRRQCQHDDHRANEGGVEKVLPGSPRRGQKKTVSVAADGHTSEDNAAPGSTFEPRDSIWAGPLR